MRTPRNHMDDDDRVLVEAAADFAAKRIAPHDLECDVSEHLPLDVLRDAAELGMAAMYCGEDAGGSGLRRLDAVCIFEELANGGRINIAACSLGGAQAAFDEATSHLADRQAFGASLLDEPTVRFTLADMATRLEASRMIPWRAARPLDDDPDKVTLCAMAELYVTDTRYDVADQALQLHGGYGHSREFGLEKIVRDLRVHRILERTNEIMRVVIGRAAATRARAAA